MSTRLYCFLFFLFFFSWGHAQKDTFVLRTNLLHWAALTPNLGVEWHVVPLYSLKVDAGWSGWEWQNGDRVHKLWYVSPELRRYFSPGNRFYLGLGGSLSEYNLKLSGTGYQGKAYSGALTAGYLLPLNRRFSMDFNLGLGYARLEYDTYSIVEGARVYKTKEQSKNWYGPVQAGISLVYIID